MRIIMAGIFVFLALATAGWISHPRTVRAETRHASVFSTHSSQSGLLTPVAYRRHYRRPRRRVVVRRRPFKRSAAIVGGSAAAGAGVGALAGGGKGAIAGGLIGGAGGYVYDRATHKKRRVVRR
jgi:hypothetical protein